MTIFIAIAMAVAAPAIHVQIAPDQPIPYVYVDDPVIVEFRASEAVSASVRAELSRSGAPSATIDLDVIRLRAQGVRWRTLDGVSSERGLYHARFTLDAGGQPFDVLTSFCRIDRPFNAPELPLTLRVADLSRRNLLAIQGVPLRHIRLDAASSELEEQTRLAVAAGLQVAVGVDAQTLSNPAAQAQDLAARMGPGVTRWEIDPTGAVEQLASLAAGLRQGNSRAPIVLTAYSTGDLSALLHAAAQYDVSGVMYRHPAPTASDLIAFRSAVEQAGYEGMPVSLLTKGRADGDPVQGPALVRQLLAYRAAGIVRTELEDTPLYDEETGFSDAYPYLSAMMHRFRNAAPIGELALSAGVRAPVFRLGDTWILALWNSADARDVVVPVGNAAELRLTDALNNPLPLPAVADAGVAVAAGPVPTYLSGRGGSVLRQAAAECVRAEAQTLLAIPSFTAALPPEMVSLLQNLSKSNSGRIEHAEFFALLGLFPYVEQQWHASRLARTTAAPALAGLTRLARALCVLEEEGGDSFIAPLKAIIANSSEAQSLYVTNSGGKPSSSRRGDWVLAVVSGLVGEAERLNDEGRTNEAKALATVAEWRARALDVAARAIPLTEPEPAVALAAPQPEASAKPKSATGQPQEKTVKKTESSSKKTVPQKRPARKTRR